MRNYNTEGASKKFDIDGCHSSFFIILVITLPQLSMIEKYREKTEMNLIMPK